MMPGLIGAVSASRRRTTGPDMNGLVLWLDTSRLTGLSDGDAIATATDWSGQGNHATQATAAKKPLYKTNILNGRPVMRFDGVDDTILTGPGVSIKDIFVVAKWSGVSPFPNYNALMSRNEASDDVSVMATYATTNIRTTNGDVWVDGVNTNSFLPMDSFHVVYKSCTAGAVGSVLVGDEGALNRWWNGDIAEILIYNRALSTAERQFEENRLMTKYALP